MPKVTVITVTRNDIENLKYTLASVGSQTYQNVEHVIIDGDSSDGSRDLICQYATGRGMRFLSEPDRGIYDAMNKGLKIATGEIVVMMNGGDTFSGFDDLEFVASDYARAPWHWAYGAMRSVDNARRPLRGSVQAPFSKRKLELGLGYVPHQSFYIASAALREVDHYRTDLGVAADQEFIIRVANRWPPRVWIRFMSDCLEGGAHAQVPRLQRERIYRRIREAHGARLARSWSVDLAWTFGAAFARYARDRLASIVKRGQLPGC